MIFGRDLSSTTWTASELGMKYNKKQKKWSIFQLLEDADQGQQKSFNPYYEVNLCFIAIDNTGTQVGWAFYVHK